MRLFALLSLIKITKQDMHWHSLCVCIQVLLIQNQGPPVLPYVWGIQVNQGLLSKDMLEVEEGFQDIPAGEINHYKEGKGGYVTFKHNSQTLNNILIVFYHDATMC